MASAADVIIEMPTVGETAATHIRKTLAKLLVECPVEESNILGTLVIEPPARLIGGVSHINSTFVGAFSYSWSRIPGVVRSIGRYCSLAADISFGELEHPTTWLSTSSFTYDNGWLWRDFAAEHGVNYAVMPHPHATDRPPIVIGNDVWIGLGAYIKGGVTLGDGCIVGAKAVVTKDVPPYAIVVGNPARVVRFRFDEKTIDALLALQWWRYAFTDLTGLPLQDISGSVAQLQARLAISELRPYEPRSIQLTRPSDQAGAHDRS